MTTNIIPRYTDFTVLFTNVTLDETALNFSQVSGWFFSLGQEVDGTPLVTKNSIAHAVDFTIDGTAKTVGVYIPSSGLIASGGLTGDYFAGLWANISGKYAGNLQTTFNIQPQIRRT